jgi:hypothetical protein
VTSRQYHAIDERVEAEIKRLKREHPNLGHEGLMDALAQQGMELDEAEFKEYVRTHKLAPEIKRQSWGWVGARWIPFLVTTHRRPHENRSFRRLFWRKRHD